MEFGYIFHLQEVGTLITSDLDRHIDDMSIQAAAPNAAISAAPPPATSPSPPVPAS